MTDTAHDNVVDDPILEEEWLAAPTQRSRLRLALAAVLVAALCFLAGAMVQKQYGASDAAASGLPAGAVSPPQGGAFPGAGTGGFPTTTDSGGGSTDDADAEAVIGTVVAIDGDVWVVKDLGGKRHRVAVGDDASLVHESALERSQVRVGDSVDITGSTISGGRWAADKVTVR